MLGKQDITLFTYDMPAMSVDFTYTQFFPIIGPLGATTTYRAALPFESVPVNSGVLTVAETAFSSFDDGSEVTASVAIVC